MVGIKVSSGGKKLMLMATLAIVISLVMTTASLAIYHYSGDIYLDRSRPGFLPDQEEVETSEDDEEGEYEFSRSGALKAEELDEYLKALQIEVKALDEYQNPFGEEGLSNERFGL